jgi:two-component system, OmpR family, sensor kinase
MATSSTSAAAPPTSAGGGPRQALSRFAARTPLRVKLITALLALVIAALACISIAGIFVFRGYLLNKTDHELTTVANFVNNTLELNGVKPDSLSVNPLGPYVEGFIPAGQHLTPSSSAAATQLPSIPSNAAWLKANSGKLVTVPAQAGGSVWRVLTVSAQYPSQNLPSGLTPSMVSGTLFVGEDLGNVNQTIGQLVSINLIVGGVVVLVLAIIGVAVVRASMRPLAEIEQTAGAIAAGDLSRRVPDRDPRTEVGSLGRSLNIMLAHIEAAFSAQAESEATARRSESRMRQFAADASHELRTPLTAIKGFAEYYRQRGGVAANGSEGELTREDLDRIMNRVETEATRMGILVDDLLLLARIDQQRPLEQRPVDMLALAADAVQDASVIAPDREVRLTVGHDTAFLVIGDEARLRQVIGNLMSNALTHTPDGTPIQVHVRSGVLDPGHRIPAVVLEVVDHGPGMSPDQAQRVFERFYRADQTRARHTGGTGLGLAIVSALVSAHGGTVTVDTEPGRGATFRVSLPLAPEAQGPHATVGPPPQASPVSPPGGPGQQPDIVQR